MLQSILTFLQSLFGLGEKIAENKAAKIPLQEEAIKSEAKKDAVSDELKIDKKKDRQLRNERKIIYEYDQHSDYLKDIIEKQAIYYGTKEQVLEEITTDPARVIRGSRLIGEQKDLRKKIERSKAAFFIIAVHPVTLH